MDIDNPVTPALTTGAPGALLPESSWLWLETNVDNYGEVWVDGQIDRSFGVILGINAPNGSSLAQARTLAPSTESPA